MKKNIFYIGNFSFPDGNAPGTRVLGNGHLLRELGFEVTFIGIDNTLPSNSSLLDTKQTYLDFDYYNLPYPQGARDWLSYKKRYKEVASILKDKSVHAVILYGSPTISLFGAAIRKWCKKRDVKIISDCVDWLSSGSGGILFRLVKFIDTTYQKRVFNSSSDGIIAVSSFLSDFYSRKGCITVIIPPLVDVNRFPQTQMSENRPEGVSLIYVGQPFPIDGRVVKSTSYKDRLDIALRALYELRDINFTFNIYGLTKEQYLSVIPGQNSIIRDLGDRILFNGKINNSDAISHVANADFVLLLRDKNRMSTAGFPTKFVEAISSGTPVITNRTSDLERYLINGTNGFFVSNEDQSDLIRSLRGILTMDKKAIALMKKQCHESGLFSIHRFKEPMKNFIDILGI